MQAITPKILDTWTFYSLMNRLEFDHFAGHGDFKPSTREEAMLEKNNDGSVVKGREGRGM